MERMRWATGSQEAAVERFYGQGAAHFGEFHGGYLNFGLWEEGVGSYLQAAENLVHRLGTLLGLTGSSRLLDVACGMGTQDVYLFDHFGQPEIDAIDITWAHLRHAEDRARRRGCGQRVRFRHGSAVAIPFADGAFTHLLSIEGPVHFGTRERFFHETLRVLEPGGVLALSDYTLKRPPRNPIERLILAGTRSLWRIPKENLWTTDEYRRRLSAAGFADVDVQEVGALTIPGYFFEQRRPEVRRELARIRGFVAGRLGHVIDLVACGVYRMGLAEYVLVRARKPR